MGKRVGALKFFIYSCFVFYVSSENLIVVFAPGFFQYELESILLLNGFSLIKSGLIVSFGYCCSFLERF